MYSTVTTGDFYASIVCELGFLITQNTRKLTLYFFLLLQKIEKSSVVMMDRWHIEVSEQTGTQETGGDVADRIPYNIINNYFSIGVVSCHRL